MNRYTVRYHRIPTNYNDPANAVVEAESSSIAREIVRQQLGEGNGVRNYVIHEAEPYVPVETEGRIIIMNS